MRPSAPSVFHRIRHVTHDRRLDLILFAPPFASPFSSRPACHRALPTYTTPCLPGAALLRRAPRAVLGKAATTCFPTHTALIPCHLSTRLRTRHIHTLSLALRGRPPQQPGSVCLHLPARLCPCSRPNALHSNNEHCPLLLPRPCRSASCLSPARFLAPLLMPAGLCGEPVAERLPCVPQC